MGAEDRNPINGNDVRIGRRILLWPNKLGRYARFHKSIIQCGQSPTMPSYGSVHLIPHRLVSVIDLIRRNKISRALQLCGALDLERCSKSRVVIVYVVFYNNGGYSETR